MILVDGEISNTVQLALEFYEQSKTPKNTDPNNRKPRNEKSENYTTIGTKERENTMNDDKLKISYGGGRVRAFINGVELPNVFSVETQSTDFYGTPIPEVTLKFAPVEIHIERNPAQ